MVKTPLSDDSTTRVALAARADTRQKRPPSVLSKLAQGILAASLPLLVAPASRAELPVPCGACGAGISHFVTSGAANYSAAGKVGTIQQQTERAILNWQSFNVSADSTVNFQQPSSTSATLNRIHQQDPSRILGSINANGQVFLINQNGLVFGKDAQVNTQALTASTLRVSDQVFNTLGITGAINADPAAGVTAALPAFDGTSNPAARIEIESGARIKASDRVLVIAPEVVNHGTIETPGGQAILAGSKDKVYLAADQELRGLLVEVDTGGSVSNLGDIISERGNTTLVGLAVNQSGRVRATTTVNVNGSIRLIARDRATPASFTANNGVRQPVATRAGTLEFGTDSVTEVVPADDGATAVDAQPQSLSRISGMGKEVTVRSGAAIVATGGNIELTATSRPDLPLSGTDRSSRLKVESGSRIDASGDRTAEVPMSRNQGTLRLFGNELADVPVQRDGVLRGADISVDLRRGTAVADVSKLYNDVKRTVNERLASGGTITLGSEGDIVLAAGSALDFAGGQVRYLDGYIETTRLLRAGRVVDISDADPNVVYDGIFGSVDVLHRKWGVRESFSVEQNGRNSAFNAGYIEGKDAGTLNISGRLIALDATLEGHTVSGPWQRERPGTLAGGARPFDEFPLGGRLTIAKGGDAAATNIVFANASLGSGIDTEQPLPDELPLTVTRALLAEGGITRLAIESVGRIDVPADFALDLGNDGQFVLSATRIAFDGQLRSPGGTVTLRAIQFGSIRGDIALGEHAAIDVSGQWVNDRAASFSGRNLSPAPLALDAGRVSLVAQGDLTLAHGSVIAADAGAWQDNTSRLRFGTAGSIDLRSAIPDEATLTRLALDGELRAFGFDAGGSLRLDAAGFALGGGTTSGVALAADFFANHGFGRIELNAGRDAITLAPDATLNLLPLSRQLLGNALAAPSGSLLEGLTETIVLPLERRAATHFSASLARAPGVPDATAMHIGSGARLEVTPEGSITLSADSDIRIDGQLFAPAGTVTVELAIPGAVNERGYRADQSIYLGAGASIDASGIARIARDRSLLRQGSVLDGGTITLDARRGYLLAAPGSVLRADGAQDIIDLPSATTPGAAVGTLVGSNAGRLILRAAEGILLGGTLSGVAGGPRNAAGELTISLAPNARDPGEFVASDPTNPQFTQFPLQAREIILAAARPEVPAFGTAIDNAGIGKARVAAADISGGGFDALRLNAEPMIAFSVAVAPGQITVEDGLTLTLDRALELDAALIAATETDTLLRAPRIVIGPSNTALRATTAPVAGSGSLTLAGAHIDLRNHVAFSGLRPAGDGFGLVLQSSGDIRASGLRFGGEAERSLFGSLSMPGSLHLDAARIYPGTLTDYRIDLTGADTTLLITASGTAAPLTPLTAAGALHLTAATIEQHGHLLVPFGELELRATDALSLGSGSTTSTSAAGMTTLFGSSEFGTDWIYELGDVVRVLDATPAKRIRLEAPLLSLEAGSLIDLRGGGDLLTYEFVPGPGGRRDILAADNSEGAFAILPGSGGAFGVFDPFESGGSPGDGGTVTLADNARVPAGTYARLAPRYALLPGAFLVTPLAGTQDTNALATPTQSDGVTAIAVGRLGVAGTDISSARSQGYSIESGAEWRQRAEYNEFLASTFFAEQGRGIPGDGGQLSLAATDAVRIAGQLAADSAAGARGALVDIAANSLAIVNARTATVGRVELLANELANFAAANVLLGGVRSVDGDVATVDVVANDILLDAGVSLTARDIVLTARDTVTLAAGSRLRSNGTARSGALQAYEIDGDGAFARTSVDAQATLTRSNASGSAGDLTIAADALLEASGSITLEASRDFVLDGLLSSSGGSVSLSAARINVGEIQGTPDGLSLDNTQLARLAPAELRLSSASSVDIYGQTRLQTGLLRIEAAGLRGFGTATDEAVLSATTLSIGNTRGVNADAAASGSGSVRIAADTLEVAGGTFAFSGFADSNLDLTDSFLVADDSTLTFSGDVLLTAPALIAATGAVFSLDVTGHLQTTAVAASVGSVASDAGLGARVQISADHITHGGTIVLPSGTLALTARAAPGIVLGDGSVLDLAGRDFLFGSERVGSRGGLLTLAATLGDVVIDAATIRVGAGASGGDAGGLTVSAAQGVVALASDAVLQSGASAGAARGDFALGARELTTDFTSLNDQLNGGDFGGARHITLTTGNLTLAGAGVVRAEDVLLAVDGGRLDIAGSIVADAPRGGGVRLHARDGVTLASTARISARATAAGQQGGLVELGATQGDVVLAAGASIAVHGTHGNGQSSDDGLVRVRAARVGNTGVRLTQTAATIEGAARIDIEAFRSYTATTINTTLVNNIHAHNTAYFANAGTIENALGVAGDSRYHLLPGVEIIGTTDLTLGVDWDLFSARYAGEAGVLTLRAGRDLRLNRDLSDGFARTGVSFFPERDVVQSGDSWSFRLVGGATSGAANPLAAGRSDGDVVLANNAHVRTGTGSIAVSAGGNLSLGTGSSAIYTAGVNRGTGAFSAEDAEVLLRGDFLTDGGDIHITLGGDAIGVPGGALPDYLPRVAGFFEFYAPDKIYPASWAVDASKFQGVGTLGGGDIHLNVGGDLRSLTIALPTNALPLSMQSGDLDIAGGGNLEANIGGAVIGGTVLLGGGSGTLRTDEDLRADPSNNQIAPVFAIGDAQLTVSARAGVLLETVFNPTVAEQDPNQGLVDQFFFPQPTYFYTYGEDAGVRFETLANDVTLSARGDRIGARYNDRLVDPTLLTTLPGSLDAISFAGDIVVRDRLDLFPAPRGSLRLLAGENVTADGAGEILQSDADVATLPTASLPTSVLNGVLWRQLLLSHAAVPVHLQDDTPALIVSRNGSIGTIGLNTLTLNLAEQARLVAGIDISDLNLVAQHARQGDRTTLSAAHDIVYRTTRRADGRLSENNGLIAVAGPGALELVAGRDVDFGAARGLETRGNLANPALAPRGADVSIWTGYDSEPALAAFAREYLTGSTSVYASDLAASLAANGAADFATLPAAAQRDLVMQVFFAELRASGIESSKPGTGFKRGERAIETLFPAAEYPGDLRSFLSRITTLDGGNISLLVPGGLVNAGVASTGTISKAPAELGIVAQGEGDISAYTLDDFLVNASRVFALDGGDILVWSAEGNIDAGRGARSALSIPPPTTSFDAQGNVVIEFPAAIAGSGIQAAVSTPGRDPGDVFLFAPRGVVDAGDAGISSAGNLTIAATAVLGADNISVGGAATGVPATSVSVPVGLASASAAAGSATNAATAGATEKAGQSAQDTEQQLGADLVSMVTVQFLGFGE